VAIDSGKATAIERIVVRSHRDVDERDVDEHD
jgi:hypothetical protein